MYSGLAVLHEDPEKSGVESFICTSALHSGNNGVAVKELKLSYHNGYT